MNLKIKISARHIHLTKKDFAKLFGDTKMIREVELTQPGQFASNLYVDVKNGDKIFKHIRVVGPIREYTQLEISKTDAHALKIKPPVRNSGDLRNAVMIEIIGPKGSISRECAIIASRHIHITNDALLTSKLNGHEKVKIKISGEKGGIIDNVYVKPTPLATYELHLDLDDANSHLLNNDDEVEIILD
ncbi:MAG TPA: PduL/EutD family phosphate acyltransferase [Bacilli bacterium]|nr:PduL/EutD family phosphate acyltransferase [Bacilli bacterium]